MLRSDADDVRRLVGSTSDDEGSGVTGDEEERYGTFPNDGPGSDVAVVVAPSSSSAAGGAPIDKVARSRQTLSALGFSFGAFAVGNMLGWSSTALPNLEASNSSLPITTAQGAWVGSLVCLGAMLQGPTTGYLMTRFGRRNTMLMMCVPLFIGWLFVICATDVYMLYVGRLVIGLSAGSFSVITPIFVSEISSPAIRGALGTLFQILVVCGIFSMYVIGTYVSWKGLAIFCAAMPWVIFVTVFFLGDSPSSYMMRSRPDLARRALVWLRNSPDIDEELYAIQKQVEETRRIGNRYRTTNILCVSDVTIRKPLYLSIFLMFAQQLSGINSVVVFTVNIFQSSGSSLDPHTSTIIVGGLLVVTTLLSTYTANRVGRRPTIIVTGLLMMVSLIAFGAFFYLKTYKPGVVDSLQWMPITALVIYISAFSFGLGPLAWLMMGELLPTKIVGVAGALAATINWTLAFLVTLCFTYLTSTLGDYGTYWLYAFFCAIGIWGTMRYVPETRNKTLREIQEAMFR